MILLKNKHNLLLKLQSNIITDLPSAVKEKIQIKRKYYFYL